MIIKLPPLKPWQKDIIDYYNENTSGKWIITKSPRQVGKSALITVLLLCASMKTPHSWSLCVSPVRSQAKKLFDDINNLASMLITKSNASQLEIKFINGSVVKFCSAEQSDSVRGYTTKKTGIMCVDEGAFIKSDFFYNILVPITNVHKSDIFVFSTPKFRQGLFYELYLQGENPEVENVVSYDWTQYDLSEFLPDYLLDMYRSQLPKLSFEAEYLGHFISGDGSVFTDFNKAVQPYLLQTDKEVLMTVDWGSGSGQDYTVITVGQYSDGKVRVERQIAFNDKTPTATIDVLVEMVDHYIHEGFKEITLVTESNSIGRVYQSMLVEKVDAIETQWNDACSYFDEVQVSCCSFTTTNVSKKRAIERLELMFEQGAITLPNDDKLLNELAVFEAKVNNLGTVTYAAPSGYHDDRVMSLLFLVDRLFVNT